MKKYLLLIVIIPFVISFFVFKEKNFDQDIIFIGSSLPKNGTIKELGIAVELGTKCLFFLCKQTQSTQR